MWKIVLHNFWDDEKKKLILKYEFLVPELKWEEYGDINYGIQRIVLKELPHPRMFQYGQMSKGRLSGPCYWKNLHVGMWRAWKDGDLS